MENKIFEIKSFARIKFLSNIESGLGIGLDSVLSSEKINFFDKIYFEEKNNSNGSVEIKKKGDIKFPTNNENYCFLAAKEVQKLYAKKNKGLKPKSISITIEKNIPLYSGLGGAFGNMIDVIKFLNNFWKIDLNNDEIDEKILEIGEKFFSEDLKNFLYQEKNFFDKKIFIFIPKYILIEKVFFENILNSSKNFSEAQKKIKEIFPDLEKFIKIFLENGAEYSDISGKGGVIFGIFDKNISEDKIKTLKKSFEEKGDFIEV